VKGDCLEAARQVGADLALRKPLDPDELLRIVARLLPGGVQRDSSS
jgi:CheY-like chemotaxis protein